MAYKLINIIILLYFLIWGSSCEQNSSAKNNTSENGKNRTGLPEFTLQTLDGNDIISQNFTGKVLVVDFWATWCAPCIREIPAYNKLNDKFKGRNFAFIGITMDSGDGKILKKFAEKYNIEYPIYIGNYNTVAAFGGVRAFPTTFVLDKQGHVREFFEGAVEKKIERITELVDSLL